MLIRRSTLILPVNVPRFVEKAHLRGADAIMLDLEDAVPSSEKAGARRMIREAIPLVSRGGGEVFVRLNHDAANLTDDLDASVHPGLESRPLGQFPDWHPIGPGGRQLMPVWQM